MPSLFFRILNTVYGEVNTERKVNMGQVVNINPRVKTSFCNRLWWKAKYNAKKLYWWVKDNPAEAALAGSVITAVVGGGVKITKGLIRTHNLHKDTYNKERYVYDHSLGAYLKTKRKLTNNDIVEINRRMAEGKKKSEVLAEMGLLE